MRKLSIMTAGLALAGLAAVSTGAQATVASQQWSPAFGQTDGNVELATTTVIKKKVVRSKNGKSVVSSTTVTKYDRNRHGSRYHSRHGSYSYYHDGYYYSSPWWTVVPGIVIKIK